jgi:predicted N-acetyltransferase YhbS
MRLRGETPTDVRPELSARQSERPRQNSSEEVGVFHFVLHAVAVELDLVDHLADKLLDVQSIHRSRVATNVGPSASGKVRRNQPQMVPIIVLGRLAVDCNHQGRRVGSHLLRDAIIRSVRLADQLGVRATLVHALNEEARQFYLRYDFEPSPTDDLPLFLLIKDVQEMVDRITSH